ncbi:MAG: FkbM family methyltransferase [Thermosphaera sp.]
MPRLSMQGRPKRIRFGVMEVPFYEFGGENFYMAHVVDENIGDGARLRRQVRVTKLDSVIQELADNVTFVKCDVEGHELAVVKGAVGLISQEKAAWLMEVSRGSDPDMEGTHSWHIFKLFNTHRVYSLVVRRSTV